MPTATPPGPDCACVEERAVTPGTYRITVRPNGNRARVQRDRQRHPMLPGVVRVDPSQPLRFGLLYSCAVEVAITLAASAEMPSSLKIRVRRSGPSTHSVAMP